MDNEVSKFVNLLYGNLLASCPVLTGNMKSNIEFKELEDRYIITISSGVPYARYVNYNWGNRTKKSQESYMLRRKNKPQKEKANYKWVERTIQRTASSLIGEGSVKVEL